MALPQGINFRASTGFVTDGANEFAETAGGGIGVQYPRTSTQGNTVGWENPIGQVRDRTTGVDRRLAGINFTSGSGWTFRIDLPSAGNYNVRAAFGDVSSVNPTVYSLVDTSTVLAALSTGTNNNAGSFKDANNIEWTAAAWPGSNTARAATFSTTICRFRSDDAGANLISHVYIEAAGGGPSTYSYTATGGFILSGTATKVRGRVKTASGGIQTGGAAIVNRGAARAGSGGMQLGGSASLAKGRAITAAGGLTMSGAATILRGVARSASGGLLFAGHANVTVFSAIQSLIVTPVGGIVIAGGAALARGVRKAASGGITFAGRASTTFFPPNGPTMLASLLPEFVRRRRRK